MSCYDVAVELIEKNVPKRFTVREARLHSDLFKNRSISNVLSKISTSNSFPVIIKKVGFFKDGLVVWEWQEREVNKLTCQYCRHSWDYKGDMKRTKCPICGKGVIV